MSALRKPTTFKDFKRSYAGGLSADDLEAMQDKLRKQLALVDTLAIKMERPVLQVSEGACTLGSVIALINEELADVRLKKQGVGKDVLKSLQYSLGADPSPSNPKKICSKADRIAQGLQSFRELVQSEARRNSKYVSSDGPSPRLPRCGHPPEATNSTVPLLKYNNWLRNSKKSLYAMYSFHLQRNFTAQPTETDQRPPLQREESVLLESLLDVADKIKVGRFNRWVQRGVNPALVAPPQPTTVGGSFTRGRR